MQAPQLLSQLRPERQATATHEWRRRFRAGAHRHLDRSESRLRHRDGANLPHGRKQERYADAGYVGADKRDELWHGDVTCYIGGKRSNHQKKPINQPNLSKKSLADEDAAERVALISGSLDPLVSRGAYSDT